MQKRLFIYLFGPLLVILLILWIRSEAPEPKDGFIKPQVSSASNTNPSQEVFVVDSIYWSDADSGQINESFKFRLNNVDAPETGDVGAAIGGAECELERKLGFESKAWIVNFTREANLIVTEQHGLDKYDRTVIDLSVNGVDLATAGINARHLKPWPHKGRRSLSKKPDWCLVK